MKVHKNPSRLTVNRKISDFLVCFIAIINKL